MKKYINIIGLIIGLFSTFSFFYNSGNNIILNYFNSLIPLFIIEIIGLALSIFSLFKDNKKVLSIIGIILNIIPIGYFIILIFAIG